MLGGILSGLLVLAAIGLFSWLLGLDTLYIKCPVCRRRRGILKKQVDEWVGRHSAEFIAKMNSSLLTCQRCDSVLTSVMILHPYVTRALRGAAELRATRLNAQNLVEIMKEIEAGHVPSTERKR